MQKKGRGGARRLRALAVGLGFAGVFSVGCAANVNTYPPPSQAQMAGAEGNVKLAREGGAFNDAKAARLLRAAEEELATAKDRAAAGDNRGATLLLARAEADAELGNMLARQAKARSEATLVEGQLAETRRNQAAPASSAPAAPAGTSTPVPSAPTTP